MAEGFVSIFSLEKRKVLEEQRGIDLSVGFINKHLAITLKSFMFLQYYFLSPLRYISSVWI